ncbi:MAG: AAA family ATPase [Gaiellaceae bacterium]
MPGRSHELDVIEELLERVGERGGALALVGEAGVGKSALVDVAREFALARGMRVLRTTGVESEAHLPFAGLHRLLAPTLTALGRLPAPQRAAVEAAFGMREHAAPDVFLIALGALELLADAAAASPLVIVVEDAQWLDDASFDVLAFVARRVELEPIVALFSARGGGDERIAAAGLPVLPVGALDDATAAALLDAGAPDLPSDLRERVLAEAAGNPLALAELPRAIARDVDRSPAAPLPLSALLEKAFAAHSSELPKETQQLLLLAALDDHGGVREVLEALSLLGYADVPVEAFAGADVARLVTLDGARLHFRHPLVRSAIYQQAPVADRHAAHAALAVVHDGDPDRRAWHRAAALDGPDDEVAGQLEEAAERALRRGAPTVAGWGFARAAGLAADDRRRGQLLIRAGELHYLFGDAAVTVRLLREAQSLDLDPLDRMRAAFVLEVGDPKRWTGAESVPFFIQTAEQLAAAGDAPAALQALATVALRCWWANPDQSLRDGMVAAAEGLSVAPDDPFLLSTLAHSDPVATGATVLERIGARTTESPTSPESSLMLGGALAAVWAPDRSLEHLSAAVEGFRAGGQLGLLAQALNYQAWGAFLVSNTSLAATAGAEAERLSLDTGQALWSTAVSMVRALLAVDNGDPAAALDLADEAEEVFLPMRANPMLALVQIVRGHAALVDGRFDDAYANLRRIFDPEDIAFHPFVRGWVMCDVADAAVHDDVNADEARAFLTEVESMAERTGASMLQAQVSYARAVLADDADAEPLFRAALADELPAWPGLRARMLFAFGAWLRRRRRIAEARSPLRGADEAFRALGISAFAERARQELRATGETARRRRVDTRNQLTPQELQIARMAADGLTNREIGQKLYLSHRTVGSHLYRIFPKLGVTARGQLRDAIEELATA